MLLPANRRPLMFRSFLGVFAALLFLSVMAFLTIPEILVRRVWNHRNQADALVRRQTETNWHQTWAGLYRRMFKSILGLRMHRQVRELTYSDRYILVLNHQAALDHLEGAGAAEELDLKDVRWVVKEAMRSAPGLGNSLERAGFAFVSRNGDVRDKERIRQMAQLARADGASVALYPEGTRFNGIPRQGARYTRLRDPKAGGLEVLCEELPEYRILVVCIDWGDLRDARTMWDGAAFVGRRGRVIIWEEENPGKEGVRDLLTDIWDEMERILTQNASHLALVDPRYQQTAES